MDDQLADPRLMGKFLETSATMLVLAMRLGSNPREYGVAVDLAFAVLDDIEGKAMGNRGPDLCYTRSDIRTMLEAVVDRCRYILDEPPIDSPTPA